MLYRLGEAFDTVRSGAPATRAVMLRGPSGAGRTGLLQAFYELTVTRQNPPGYWPADLAPRTDPLTRRDVIVPVDFTVPGGVALPWLWWGLSGAHEVAAWDANPQLKVHAEAFRSALAAMDTITRKRVALATKSVFLLGGLLPVVGPAVQAVDTAVGAYEMVSGLGNLRDQRAHIVASLRTDTSRRFSPQENVLERVRHDAGLLAELSRWVPMVVVVDDAEHLDPVTLGVLNTLLRSRGARVLVVLAINTDYHPTPDSADTTEADNPGLHDIAASLADQSMLEVITLHRFTRKIWSASFVSSWPNGRAPTRGRRGPPRSRTGRTRVCVRS